MVSIMDKPDLSPPFKKIVIGGAGPAGLLLALLLGRHHDDGMSITVLEAWDRLDERLRATQYGTPASRIFRKAGVLDDIRAQMITNFKGICWRNVKDDGRRITGVDLSLSEDSPDRITVLPLNQILKILYSHCQKLDNVEIKFNHRVVGVGQDSGKAWVDVETPEKKKRFEADYVVGCDGASSTIRHELFGGEWPGITWPHTLLVQNVFYPGFAAHGWSGGNYMIDRDHWGLLAERGHHGLWRVTYGDVGGLEHEDYLRRRDWHFEAMLPGHPKPGDYRVTETNQFRIHNRCVETMRVGRVLLAADAAHVCNPFGGYGAMAGILDVGGLAECLIGYFDGEAGEEILDVYAKVRREKFLKFVDKRSIKNMRRLNQLDADRALEEDQFLQLLSRLEENPEEARAFLLKHSSIEYDFTQHYKS